jgi:2-keto-4-pentenoate hydratase/2-oxohepta-3-ene-1,7-dioic acid hydratase in catechol pathway
MKFGTIRESGQEVLIGRISDSEAVRLADAYAAAGLTPAPANMQALIEGGAAELERAAQALAAGAPTLALDSVEWMAPQTRPSKFLGVAMNNKGIRKEAHFPSDVPNYFLKAPSCLTGHGQPIIMKEHYGETIPELELAAVIGKGGKDIAPENALEHVFGYSIVNDVTSHGIKFGIDSLATTRAPELVRPHHLSWRRTHGPEDTDIFFVYHTRSKATDTFGPMGPWITTADEVADPNALDVSGWFDGEPFATDNTRNYMFSVQTVIADASKWFTLNAGDIIIFGTTAKGVGKYPHGHREINMHRMTGVIETEISGLGRLANPIVHS